MKSTDVCVVVRMYNEAAVVGPVVTELVQCFDHVVCVDDGSSDGSGAIARAAGALVVTHPVNLGGGAALKTGLRYASEVTDATHFVTFDADGQHQVSDALAMVELARTNDLDVVLGSRFLGLESDMPASRRALLRAAALFTRVTTGVALTDSHNGLRVLSRRFATRLRLTIAGMGYASELIAALGADDVTYAEHPVTVLYTDYSLGKGQRNLNSVNIVVDLALTRLWSPA
ncbi:glycosyltransferase family 2 protein [Nocardioides sp.]|uniref:glycosyltransferase family 2 protein n=1 Tax=Nocardioides sp. TaxID=35761 RepID=UPI003D0B0F63